MTALEYINLIWRYNYWGNHKLWDSLKTVMVEDFTRPVAYGIGSLHAHAVHTMWAEALWLARIKEEGVSRWTPEDYPTPETIIDQWQTVEARWMQFLDELSPADLDNVFTANASSGTFQHRVGEVLVHVVNHSSDHRAQMLRLIGDYGGQTFEQDLIFYLREQQASE